MEHLCAHAPRIVGERFVDGVARDASVVIPEHVAERVVDGGFGDCGSDFRCGDCLQVDVDALQVGFRLFDCSELQEIALAAAVIDDAFAWLDVKDGLRERRHSLWGSVFQAEDSLVEGSAFKVFDNQLLIE